MRRGTSSWQNLPSMAALGFIGLGVMGAPMAGHLLRAGHSLTVFNRTRSKAEPLAAQGATVADSLEALAAASDVILLCVSRSEDVQECVRACVPSAREGALLIDHSTIEPHVARSLHAELGAQGLGFVDAPVTGGSMGAAAGTLTVFCGGEEAEMERAMPILAAYSSKAERVGGPGFGQLMKLANQIAVAGSLAGLCESMAFASRAGLDLEQTARLLQGGAAGSWAFQNYAPKLLAGDFSPGFSVANQLKDLRYCLSAAEQVGARTPVAQQIARLLEVLDDRGAGSEATIALYRLLRERGEQ